MFQMRSLLFRSIILILVFTACDPVKKSQLSSTKEKQYITPSWNTPFHEGFEKALFRTSLEVADKQLSGISIIKKTSDTSFHLTFANEIGLTYFDLEIYAHGFKADYVFDPINKKSFLKILHRDFSTLFFSASEGKPTGKYVQKGTGEAVYLYLGRKLYTWLDIKQNSLIRLAGWSNYFDAVIIDFREYQNGFPAEIQIVNPRINLVLTLNILGQ